MIEELEKELNDFFKSNENNRLSVDVMQGLANRVFKIVNKYVADSGQEHIPDK